MLRIKRTKAAGEGRVAVHYAAAVSPRGTVDAWTPDPAAAALVTDAVARRVTDRLAAAKNTGHLTLERVAATGAQVAAAVAADERADAAAFAALQVECRDRALRLADARADNDDLRRQLEAALARLAELEGAAAARGNDLAAARERIEALEREREQRAAPPAPARKGKQSGARPATDSSATEGV